MWVCLILLYPQSYEKTNTERQSAVCTFSSFEVRGILGYHFPSAAPALGWSVSTCLATLHLSSWSPLFNDRRKVISVVIIRGPAPASTSQSEDSITMLWPMRGRAESVVFTQHSHHYAKYIFRSYPHHYRTSWAIFLGNNLNRIIFTNLIIANSRKDSDDDGQAAESADNSSVTVTLSSISKNCRITLDRIKYISYPFYSIQF